MLRTSATNRRCHWLLVLLAIGLIAELPILSTANAFFVLAESSETLTDGEDVELDESLKLLAQFCSGPKLQAPGQQERVADESTRATTAPTASYFQRAPPLC